MANRRLAPDEVQPKVFALTAENEAWAQGQIEKYPPGRQASAVIPLLWQAQKQAGGWLPQKAIEAVAQRLGMPYIRVLEVATFYTMFALEPVGEHFVQLCGTVPCHCMGALELKEVLRRKIGEQGHVTADGKLSWLEVECLGACCNAPMLQINEDYYEDLTPEILERILDDLRAGKAVSPGPQQGRKSSEPAGTVKTLLDPALYDGSRLGSWRKRIEEEEARAAAEAKAKSEEEAATAAAPSDPKPAKPAAGRLVESENADTPAKRAKEGEAPVKPEEKAAAGDPNHRTVASGEAKDAPASPAKGPERTATSPGAPGATSPHAPSTAPGGRDGKADSDGRGD